MFGLKSCRGKNLLKAKTINQEAKSPQNRIQFLLMCKITVEKFSNISEPRKWTSIIQYITIKIPVRKSTIVVLINKITVYILILSSKYR